MATAAPIIWSLLRGLNFHNNGSVRTLCSTEPHDSTLCNSNEVTRESATVVYQ